MNKMLPFLVLAAGCGIPSSALIVDLTAEDMAKLCEDMVEETFTCEISGFSYDITFGGESCEGGNEGLTADCAATVGDWRACDDAWRAALTADPCATDIPTECDPLMECVDMGTTTTGT